MSSKTTAVSKTMKKSWKREVALALLLVWAAVTLQLFFGIPPDQARDLAAAYNGMSLIVLPTAMAAFGLEAYLKHKAG